MSGFRCKSCGHKPRRVVTATTKRARGSAEPRQHKKPYGCDCHAAVTS